MSDKARSTFPIAVDFVKGELPSAEKMNGLAKQAKQSSNLIEFMLGDLWNQSGDSLLQSAGVSENALMISNIARYLGASKNLNPRIPYLPNIEKYTHKADIVEISGHEFLLEFPVKSGSSYVWTGTGAPSGSPETNKGNVNSSGKWYVNEDTGQVWTFDNVVSDWDLTYEPVVDGDTGSLATWNIVPDLDTDSSYGFQGVKIQYVNGANNQQGYLIYLPPRGPLNNRILQRSPQKDTVSPNNTKNFQSLPSTGDMLFWQSDSVDAVISTVEGEHYRYNLPKLITDSPSWGKSIAIPQGLVYLWDPINTGTIIEGIIFSAENSIVPRKYVFVAQGGNLDTWLSSYGVSTYSVSTLQNSSHASSFYPSNGLRVITVGSSISNAVSSLLEQYLNHDHSSSNSIPTRPVSHQKLSNLFDADGQGSVFSNFDFPSLDKDDHPQYLHRYGSTAGIAEGRDKYKNSMLGDLLLSSTSASSNHINTSASSYRVRFNTLNNVSVFYNQPSDALRFDHISSISPKFEFGVEGEIISRYHLELASLGTRIKTLQLDHFISMQPAGNLFLDAGQNNTVNTNNNILIGTLFGNNNIVMGDPALTEDITVGCSQEIFVRAGTTGLMPTEQPLDNGIRLYSQDRMDVAAGNTAPSVMGHAGADIFLRAGDDVVVKTGDAFIVEANGNVNITSDSDLDGSGDIILTGRSVKASLVSPVTENIVVAPSVITGIPGASAIGWSVIQGGAIVLNDGDQAIFHVDQFPHLCTINSISLWVKNVGAINRAIVFTAYRMNYGINTPEAFMGTFTTAIIPAGVAQNAILTPIGNNTSMSHSSHIIQIRAATSGSSGSDLHVYAMVRLNVTYSAVHWWPAQT